MDRIRDFGSCDRGSIPRKAISMYENKMSQLAYLYKIYVYFVNLEIIPPIMSPNNEEPRTPITKEGVMPPEDNP